MKAGYVKLGSDWYFQGDTPQTGGYLQVTDKDTLKGLKEGRIPYRVESINRPLTFADDKSSTPSPYYQQGNTSNLNSGGTETPASTSLPGTGQDFQSILKQKVLESIQNLSSSRVPGLEARQRQIQTQMLTAPASDYSNMDPQSIIRSANARGQEYAPALESVTQAIGKEKSIQLEDIQKLNSIASLMKQLSGGEIDTQVTEANGRKLLINSKTGETIKDIGASSSSTGTDAGTDGTYVQGQDPTVDSWASRIYNGQAKLSDITGVKNTGLKNKVIIALDSMSNGRLGPIQENIRNAKIIVDSLIKDNSGRKSATGTLRLGLAVGGTQGQNFKAQVDRLNALLFLNAVPQMKGMGALSEREGSRLEASASTLNNLKQSESSYLAELEKLQTNLKVASENLGGNIEKSKDIILDTKTLSDGSVFEKHADGKWYPK